ncbi:hypothetical protein IQ782_18275 [Salipiger pacificus]|uniref:Uncharacterized protein n=2 Tax=Salipiger mangrovisoli TaxID=2865933 RepID=A0ABR9X5M1_9RHOB|nr:hypothetical protein [Salipiger mangrovisoli]
MKGDLYGDQYVLLRDLDPSDGGGNGEAVLDTFNTEAQPVLVGVDPANPDDPFPIYFEEDAEGDYELPALMLPFVQEVELDRANVARAPASVMAHALEEALGKVETADEITTDTAGRIMYSTDGGATFATIDSPLENLALYQHLMTTSGGSAGAWPDVTDTWEQPFLDLLGGNMTDPDWDPSALLGAAWSKEGKITLDALLYENTTLGVNVADSATGEVDYFDFSDPAGELYDYDRQATYENVWLRWIVIEGDDPKFAYGNVYDAVFDEQPWQDEMLVIVPGATPEEDTFDAVPALLSGVNDFAQAADDTRAVIEFIHARSAEEIDFADIPVEDAALVL